MENFKVFIWLTVLAYTTVNGIKISTTSFLKIPASQVPSLYANDLTSTQSSKLLTNCITMCISMDDELCSVIQFDSSLATNNCFLYSVNNTFNFTIESSSVSVVLLKKQPTGKNLMFTIFEFVLIQNIK